MLPKDFAVISFKHKDLLVLAHRGVGLFPMRLNVGAF